MPASIEHAIADLKAQFEKAVAPWQKPGDATESVHVEQAARGQWLFWLHMLSSIECRLDPPYSVWLANKQISTKAADLCLVGARYKGKNLLVLVEAKHSTTKESGVEEEEFDWFSPLARTNPSDPFTEPI